MKKFKVFMTDTVFPDIELEKKELSVLDAELLLASSADPDKVIEESIDCDAMLTCYYSVSAEIIQNLKRCKLILKTGIGVNNIDIEAANKKGIMVANVPDYCLNEVADHAMALFLSLARKINSLDALTKAGIWDFNKVKPIPRLQGKTFGLYGFGNIAQRVAKRAKSFDMEVQAFDPYIPADVFEKEGVTQIKDLDLLLQSSDFVSLHVPLNPETKHVINKDSLKKMKPTALLINTSRGPLVKEDDLYKALKDRVIAGAALDVLENEPPKLSGDITSLNNLILTPHAGFYSDGSEEELRIKAIQEIVRTLTQGSPKNWVNKKAFNK